MVSVRWFCCLRLAAALGASLEIRRSLDGTLISKQLPPGLMLEVAEPSANELKIRLQNKTAITEALLQGLNAVSLAADAFQERPPRIQDGMTTMGDEFFDIIFALMLGPGNLQQDDFQDLRSLWLLNFTRLPQVNPSIRKTLMVYAANGNPQDLMVAAMQILSSASTSIVPKLPPNTASIFGKYFNVLGGMLQGVSDTLMNIYSGPGGAQLAVGAYLRSLESSVENLVGPSSSVQSFDQAVGNLTQNVLDYKQDVQTLTVCWKHIVPRDRQLPSYCPAGYTWDGGWYCHDSGGPSSVENTVRSKRPLVASICDPMTEYQDRQLAWCFRPCPSEMEPTASGLCQTRCGSIYPADDHAALCGVSNAAITAAVEQMVLTAFMAIGTAFIAPFALVGAVVNTAKSFIFPQCPRFLNVQTGVSQP